MKNESAFNDRTKFLFLPFMALLMVMVVLTISPQKAHATLNVTVTDSPYNANCNGTATTSLILQKAINDVNAAGGGIVTIPSGSTCLTGNLTLKSNVTLTISGTLKQSQNATDYSYIPTTGHDINDGITWHHVFFKNYPFIYGGNVSNVTVNGSGTIQMTYSGSDSTNIENAPIGFYNVTTFNISNVHINQARTYNICLFHSSGGTVSGVTIVTFASLWNTDGISIQNSQNIHVTGNSINNYDDGIYVWASYHDPRKSVWWNSDTPQASSSIEIDNNNITSNWGNGTPLIPWGLPGSVLMSGINIHNNTYHVNNPGNYAINCWCDNPYHGASPYIGNEIDPSSMDNITYSGNIYNGGPIDSNLQKNITNLHADYFITNSGFESQMTDWSYVGTLNTNVGTYSAAHGQDGTWYGYLQYNTYSALYQSRYLPSGSYTFSAKVQTSGSTYRYFVYNQDTATDIANLNFSNTPWATNTISFTLASPCANCRIGFDNNGGVPSTAWARMDSVSLIKN